MKKLLLAAMLLALVSTKGTSQWNHKLYIGIDYGLGLGLGDFSDKDYTSETSAAANGGPMYLGLVAGYDLEEIDNLGVTAMVRFSKVGISDYVLADKITPTIADDYSSYDDISSYSINQFMVGTDYTLSFWNDILALENKVMVGLMSATRPEMTFTENNGNGSLFVINKASKIAPTFMVRTGLRWKIPYITLPLGIVTLTMDTDRVYLTANVSYTAAKVKFDIESDQADSPLNGELSHNIAFLNFGLTLSIGLIEN